MSTEPSNPPMSIRSFDQILIGGQWRDPAGATRIDVVSPHTEQIIAHAAAASVADVDAAVRAARTAFDTGPWPRLPLADRLAAVQRLAAVYGTHLDEMADLITAQMGSPRSFSRLAAEEALRPRAASSASQPRISSAAASPGALPPRNSR